MNREAPRPSRAVLVAAVAVAALAAACDRTGPFLWVDAVPRNVLMPATTSAIAVGDVIGVRVWNQEANSVDRTRVRDDGKISLPFLNDVDVAGQEPAELAHRIEVKLKAFIVNPVVTVVIHERRPLRVSVVGQVARAGTYELDSGAGVLNAIAAAGGLTPFAGPDRIYVLRSGYWTDGNPAPARIRFKYDDLRRGTAPASVFRLRYGDFVVVE